MAILRIAMAQINPVVGDFAGNADKIMDAFARAAKDESDLVLAPELCLSGYPPEDLLLKRGFIADCRSVLDDMVSRVSGPVLVVGFPEGDGKRIYNAAAVIMNGRLAGVYRKLELPNYGVFDEKRYFEPGTEIPVFLLAGVRLMVTICEDIWIEGGLVERRVKDAGAEVVVNISGSPFNAGKLEVRRNIVFGFARRTGAAVFYNNMTGGQDELVFDGGSMAALASGEVVAMARRFEEDLLVTDMEARGKGARPGEAVTVLDHVPRPDRGEAPTVLSRPLSRVEEVYRALVMGTRDYVTKAGFKKALIGLSGGVDSSLTAKVAVDALGRDNVVGVTMPSQYTSGETLSDAELLAKNLGVRMLTIPIGEIFRGFMEGLSDAFQEGVPGLEAENLQARIRGNLLMALSNRFGWIVLTTGNKSETAVGYCTLYGDMAGGFAVIKDVPKTLVYELCAHVNEEAGREVIPSSVILRPPTAELRPDQKDEDSLPPYAVLDPILQAYVEEDKSAVEITALGFDEVMVLEIIRMVDRNEYKRRQAPPGVKITPKAFGRDRRFPIVNRYRGR